MIVLENVILFQLILILISLFNIYYNLQFYRFNKANSKISQNFGKKISTYTRDLFLKIEFPLNT